MADAPPPISNNAAKHRLEARLGEAVAHMDYEKIEDGLLVPHTVVPAAFEGRGIGGALAKAMLAFAKDKGLLVLPTCPFFAGYLSKHPEYRDQVHPRFFNELGYTA